MVRLFHITSIKNLKSIMQLGLLPHQPNCISIKKGPQPIFLTDDPDFIAKTQLTNNWIFEYKLIILSINAKNYNIKPYYINYRNPPVLAPHEYIYEYPITKEDIKIYGNLTPIV